MSATEIANKMDEAVGSVIRAIVLIDVVMAAGYDGARVPIGLAEVRLGAELLRESLRAIAAEAARNESEVGS